MNKNTEKFLKELFKLDKKYSIGVVVPVEIEGVTLEFEVKGRVMNDDPYWNAERFYIEMDEVFPHCKFSQKLELDGWEYVDNDNVNEDEFYELEKLEPSKDDLLADGFESFDDLWDIYCDTMREDFTVPEFIKRMKVKTRDSLIPPTEFVINSEYKAVFKKGDDFVRVGCQKIPKKKIKELAELL